MTTITARLEVGGGGHPLMAAVSRIWGERHEGYYGAPHGTVNNSKYNLGYFGAYGPYGKEWGPVYAQWVSKRGCSAAVLYRCTVFFVKKKFLPEHPPPHCKKRMLFSELGRPQSFRKWL